MPGEAIKGGQIKIVANLARNKLGGGRGEFVAEGVEFGAKKKGDRRKREKKLVKKKIVGGWPGKAINLKEKKKEKILYEQQNKEKKRKEGGKRARFVTLGRQMLAKVSYSSTKNASSQKRGQQEEAKKKDQRKRAFFCEKRVAGALWGGRIDWPKSQKTGTESGSAEKPHLPNRGYRKKYASKEREEKI